MSVTITLAELADLAFGTADGNSPQVGALRILLRGLLENLPPQEAPAQVREDERGLPEPVTGVARRKCCSLRQQRRPWLGRAEGQPSHPSGPPGTPELPAPGGPAAEEWQMVQLRKRMEVTEEVMAKVRNHPPGGACPRQGPTPCPTRSPALCSVLPYRGSCSALLSYTSILPCMVSWLMPLTALHHVLLLPGTVSSPI